MRGTKAEHDAEIEYILGEYAHLRPWGIRGGDFASRLGISRESLRYILRKAAERGDPRSDWTPHIHECTGTNESLQHHRARGRVA